MDGICNEEYILWMTYVMEDTFYIMDDICHRGYILWKTYVM